jgi:hypothetical protein
MSLILLGYLPHFAPPRDGALSIAASLIATQSFRETPTLAPFPRAGINKQVTRYIALPTAQRMQFIRGPLDVTLNQERNAFHNPNSI